MNRIVIYGSTYLTEVICKHLLDNYNLIGYVPCKNPTIPGNMNGMPEVSENEDCDIKISIQYDKMITDTKNAYNLHTGLLPSYGGTNILDYTIQNGEVEQGLTFHKITEDLDYGPILSKITYPVSATDDSFDLYQKILKIAPNFMMSCLNLLEHIDEEEIENCQKIKPIIYRRGEFTLSEKFKKFIGKLHDS